MKEYKIAVATNNGIRINQSFGRTVQFYIYTVDEAGTYRQSEIREVKETEAGTGESEKCSGSHGNNASCGSGHGGKHDERVDILTDCRAILCLKIGPQARKVAEHRAISVFDVDMDVEAAFRKVIPYFSKVDRHMSLR